MNLSKEVNVFLDLLHERKNYENYLFGDIDQKDLSVIYSESESSQRDSPLDEIFNIILAEISDPKSQSKLRQLQQCISQYLHRVQAQVAELETRNTQLTKSNDQYQQELQKIINQEKQRKNNEDLVRMNAQLQIQNQQLQQLLDQQENNFKESELEFKEASQRLIKSNQTLREIIMNMGNVSPINQGKLKEVISYLSDHGSSQKISRPRSKQRENCSTTTSTQRHKQSVSPQLFASMRKQLNIVDQNVSYKDLHIKKQR